MRPSKANDLLHKQFQIAAPRPVIVDRCAQAIFAMYRRIRNSRYTLLLELHHDLAIDSFENGAISFGESKTKANDIDAGRGHQLEKRFSVDQVSKIAGLRYILVDQTPEFLYTMLL